MSFVFLNAPFEQCHGSTLAVLNDGRFVVAWFAGAREGTPDTSIWMSIQKGKQWQKPFVVAKSGEIAHWNPVLHSQADGTMFLYYKVGKFPDSWDTRKVHLDGDGRKISKDKMIKSRNVDEGKMTMGPVRGKIVELSSGTLLAPSSIEKVVGKRLVGWSLVAESMWESVIHRSTNGGKTWKPYRVPYEREKGELGGIIQPSPWEVSPGRVAAFFRSTQGFLYRSESTDDGRTWSTAVKTNIPNPNSAVDVATGHGLVAMAYNPTSGNWTKRTPLSVGFSTLEGESFQSQIDVENHPNGSFSYPALITAKDGFALSYTWCRRTIGFCHIQLTNVKRTNDSVEVDAKIGSEPLTYDFRTRRSI